MKSNAMHMLLALLIVIQAAVISYQHHEIRRLNNLVTEWYNTAVMEVHRDTGALYAPRR